MANPQDIELKITTQADLAALEETRDEVQQLGGSERKLEEDLRRVSNEAERQAREIDDVGDALERANEKMRIGRAAGLGLGIGLGILREQFQDIQQAINKIDVDSLNGVSPALAGQLDSAKKLAELFTDPLSAIQRFISGETVAEAFEATQEAIKLAAEARATAERANIAIYQSQLTVLNEQIAALKQINSLRAAQGAAEERGLAADIRGAKAEGGSTSGLQAGQIALKAFNDLDALASRASELEGGITAAEGALRVAREEAEAARKIFREGTEEVNAAAAKEQAAKDNLAQAQEALNLFKIEAKTTQDAILKEADASQKELARSLQTENEKGVQKLVDEAKRLADEAVQKSGGKLSADFAGAVQQYERIINDSIPDAQQIDQLRTIISQFAGSQTAFYSGFADNFRALIGGLNDAKNIQAQQAQEIAQLRTQIQSLAAGR